MISHPSIRKRELNPIEITTQTNAIKLTDVHTTYIFVLFQLIIPDLVVTLYFNRAKLLLLLDTQQ